MTREKSADFWGIRTIIRGAERYCSIYPSSAFEDRCDALKVTLGLHALMVDAEAEKCRKRFNYPVGRGYYVSIIYDIRMRRTLVREMPIH
jgi:hypothetical protein